MNIDRDTIIGDILDMDAGCEDIFLSMGMACMGCPASRGETVEEACAIHGIDPVQLIAALRQRVGSAPRP